MKAIKFSEGDIYCRIEDAIFFDNDSFSRIKGDSIKGFSLEERASIDQLEEYGWADLYPMFTDENEEYVATTGETSWGGAGFISLKDKVSGSFKWLIHLSTMNNPQRISIETDLIRVTTDLNYPDGLDFVVPINAPMNFRNDTSVANQS
ncbi:MAG TPA: hypothetical protein DCE41_13320 [Cytophagales bacterium]|nr:hypothetical protein [Cytophagales bacterium]HAA22453.1 hypothetical protein [Cytophagales bacterium]HAP59746.1 hypothetical protein [Cytophagales bacterium]